MIFGKENLEQTFIYFLFQLTISTTKETIIIKLNIIIIIILFIVQCWTQASKPEPLKQDTQKEKKKINLYIKL